jgi:prepilin-type processing-associated H-X9-DG protein
MAARIADGLTYLHQQGILHLDVKTSNVMYLDGHATSFDFSVAKKIDPEQPFIDNAGTRDCMAPEQILCD